MFASRPPTSESLPLLAGPLIFALSVVAMVGGSTSPAGTVLEPWIDTSNREAVVVAWALEQERATPSMTWTGSYEACDAGLSSRPLALATIARVNYYRAMAGVPASVGLDDDYSDRAQHAALTMSATGKLSHAPDDSYTCLDPVAREGAANSNLYLGRIGPAAIDGYIEDPGERNRDVGHRNTILHPPTTSMGVGHVAGGDGRYAANALWVFDEGVFAENPALREPAGFVAWPPRGYVPSELVHPRWSFGLSGADFDNATVTMTLPAEAGSASIAQVAAVTTDAGEPTGTAVAPAPSPSDETRVDDGVEVERLSSTSISDQQVIPLEVVTRHSLAGYVPSPIVVWEPDPSDPAVPGPLFGGAWPEGVTADLVVDVVVDGVVVDGETTRFEYQVTLLAPDPPDSRLGVAFDVAVRAIGRASSLLTVATPVSG